MLYPDLEKLSYFFYSPVVYSLFYFFLPTTMAFEKFDDSNLEVPGKRSGNHDMVDDEFLDDTVDEGVDESENEDSFDGFGNDSAME